MVSAVEQDWVGCHFEHFQEDPSHPYQEEYTLLDLLEDQYALKNLDQFTI